VLVNLRRGLIPALGLLALAFVTGVAGYFTAGGNAKAREAAPASQPAFVRGVVQGISSDRITLTTDTGPLDLSLSPTAPVEALRRTTFDRITVGDWLNGGAVANAQTLFALSGVVVIPQAQLGSPP
jgi:hypothetical protein